MNPIQNAPQKGGLPSFSIAEELSVLYSMQSGFCFLIALTRVSMDSQRYCELFTEQDAQCHYVNLNTDNAWASFVNDLSRGALSSKTVLMEFPTDNEFDVQRHLALLNRSRSRLESNLHAPLCILIREVYVPLIVVYAPDMFTIKEHIFYPVFD